MKPLDIFLILIALLFATGMIVDQRWAPEIQQHKESLRVQRAHLKQVADFLAKYKLDQGRYPTSEEGLDVVPGLREACFAGEFAALAPSLRDKPGVRAPQGVPYLYENRRGDPEQVDRLYVQSPARHDRKGERFSREVADGVFVTSLGLMQDMQKSFGRAWLDALLWFSGGVLVFLAIAYIFKRNREPTDRYRGINATIMVGVAVLFTLVAVLTRGKDRLIARTSPPPLSSMSGAPRSDLAAAYLAILRSFAEHGVYDRARYVAVEKAVAAEFGLEAKGLEPEQPADAPPGDPSKPDDSGH